MRGPVAYRQPNRALCAYPESPTFGPAGKGKIFCPGFAHILWSAERVRCNVLFAKLDLIGRTGRLHGSSTNR